MRFTETTINQVNEVLSNKKKQKPMSSSVVGVGVNLRDGLGDSIASLNNWQLCKVDDLSRVIEELTMLKESIEEVTGVIL